MGKFDFQIPDDFVNSLGKLAHTERYARPMLEAGAAVLKSYEVRELESRPHPYALGEMIRSINISDMISTDNGWSITVIPEGTDDNGVRNMEKLAYYEYGTSRYGKKRQPARPFIDKVKNDAEASVLDTMRRVYESEISK